MTVYRIVTWSLWSTPSVSVGRIRPGKWTAQLDLGSLSVLAFFGGQR